MPSARSSPESESEPKLDSEPESSARSEPAPTPGRTEPRSPKRARLVGWSLSLSASLLVALAGVLLVRWVESGAQPPYMIDPNNPGPPADERPPPKPSNLLRLAGSGSNLPLTRALADAFVATRPWLRVRVHESIGSRGGVRATADAAIEVGLVSRPLKPAEAALGLQTIPYARVAVVVAANPSVPVRGLDRETLLELYAGRQGHWADGSPVHVLQREAGDSSHAAAAAAIPGFAEVDDQARADGLWRVLLHDRAMQEALIATPGAIGLFDQGLATIQDLPVLTLSFEGQRPREEAVRSGAYPLYKDLAFVIPSGDLSEPDPLALEFIAFVFSPDGQALIRSSGYVPLEPPPRSTFAQLRAQTPPKLDDRHTPGEPIVVEAEPPGHHGETAETAETAETEETSETSETSETPGETDEAPIEVPRPAETDAPANPGGDDA